jgi:hypothetical protein
MYLRRRPEGHGGATGGMGWRAQNQVTWLEAGRSWRHPRSLPGVSNRCCRPISLQRELGKHGRKLLASVCATVVQWNVNVRQTA